MTFEEAEKLEITVIIEQTSKRKRSQASWVAIYELARRALCDEQLLDAACAAISRDRAIGIHYVPLGSFLAVGDILNSGNEQAIRRLLREMDDWTAFEQHDAISPWAGHKDALIQEATRKLMRTYNWSPKYVATAQPER